MTKPNAEPRSRTGSSIANNPLTWRVIVNRVWQYHFGRGIVDTPNDFGRMGHAADASRIARLARRRVPRQRPQFEETPQADRAPATAYRRSSAHDDANAKIDADNRLSVAAESAETRSRGGPRFAALVAGKLDLTMGGPSFQDFKIEKPEHSPHYQYHLHDPENPAAWRRSIYRFIVRSKQQPFLTCLDCADPSLAVEKRNETITPQQALALLNNDLSIVMAKHFAERLGGKSSEDADRATDGVSAGTRSVADGRGTRRTRRLRQETRLAERLPGGVQFERVRVRGLTERR